MYETFLPGKWKDVIDANDFINLNKKPFFDETFFLNDKFSFSDYSSFLDSYFDKGEILDFPNEKLFSIRFLHEELSSFVLENKKFPFPFGREKDFATLYSETASLSLKNASRIGLLAPNFGDSVPPIFSPDIRQLPLYGSKRLIQTKRQLLKKTENDFQSPTWIEKRIDLHRQIEQLEKFENMYSYDTKDPADSTKKVMNNLLLSMLFAIRENPYTTFHIPSLLDFIDIYFDKDISSGNINETDATSLIAEFYTKLLFVHYFFKEKDINFLVTETIFSSYPTKSTYRFLLFYETLEIHKFHLSVAVKNDAPKLLEEIFDRLIDVRSPLRFVSRRVLPKQGFYSLSHLGFSFESDKDFVLFNKPCELTKIFFLALNGGKDTESNSNLVPVYQKFQKDTIDYDDFYDNFTDFVSQVFTIYSEANNLLMYLSEKYFSHPFRNSLKQDYLYYHYIFSFLNIDKLAMYLLAIKNDKYLLKRDSKKFITDFEITSTFSDDEIDEMISELAFLLESEVKKTPYYEYGKPSLFLHLKKPVTSPNHYKLSLFPPEMLPVRFIPETIEQVNSFRDVLSLFNLNILDVKIK